MSSSVSRYTSFHTVVRPVEREFSRLNAAIDKVVVSDTLRQDHTAPWRNPRIVKRAQAHDAIVS